MDDYGTPKFDFSDGIGEPLAALACFTASPKSRNAAQALETALEPIHRIVYGRAGVTGERRRALADFRGCPPAMRESVLEKMKKLTKARLRDMVTGLGIQTKISVNVPELAAVVTDFLMAPSDTKAMESPSKRAASPRQRSPSRSLSRSPPPPPAKKSRTEHSTASVGGAASSSSSPSALDGTPSEEAVIVEVYRRVLAMSFEERAELGVRALRTSLETHFGLPDGGLKTRKDIITATATTCVKALREAEDRAAAAFIGWKEGGADAAPTPSAHTSVPVSAGLAASPASAEGGKTS